MRTIASFILRLIGWKVTGDLPAELKKYIIIVAPHTSNWDFPIGLLVKYKLGYKGNYLGKHTLFRFPYGWIFRATGGHPVDRSKSNNTVDQVAELFEKNEKFILVLAPEGTRKKITKWKTGFYYMALKAEIPIVKIAMDYGKKTVFVEAPFYPSGNKDQDLKHIYDYFRHITPKHRESYHVPTI